MSEWIGRKGFILIGIYVDTVDWCFVASTSQKSESNKFIEVFVQMAADIIITALPSEKEVLFS